MTNNTINVPRELLEELRDAANDGMNATTRQHQIDYFAELIAKADALLSAPSPAGVDGLGVRAYEDSGGALYTAKLLEIMEVDSVGCEPLCRLSDAQAIIDGLRGEVADLRSMLTTVSKAGLRVRTDRDQQAQRIGELEGLLREVHGWIDESARVYRHNSTSVMLYRINAALSAGKEGE